MQLIIIRIRIFVKPFLLPACGNRDGVARRADTRGGWTDARAAFDKLRLRSDFSANTGFPYAELVEARTALDAVDRSTCVHAVREGREGGENINHGESPIRHTSPG
jgi:hypothetical protein